VLMLSGLIILLVVQPAISLNALGLGMTAGAAVFGVLAYAALTQAMRTGEVGVVTPFRYARLLFALVLGFVVFGERPDALTLLGSAVIVACGVVILSQSRRRQPLSPR
jgi:drug/metabolite transporter (DMT)-like permease